MILLQQSPAGNAQSTITRRHSLGRMMHSSTSLLLFVIATLIVVLAFFILFHHNLNATKGYKLRTLERARSQLILEQEILNMDIAKSQSLETLQNDPVVLTMKKATKVRYADATKIGVAHNVTDAMMMAPVE